MSEQLPPNSLAQLDQARAGVRDALDTILTDLRRTFADHETHDGSVVMAALALTFDNLKENREDAMVFLLAEAITRLLDAEVTG